MAFLIFLSVLPLQDAELEVLKEELGHLILERDR
jgi:hypothetical protein